MANNNLISLFDIEKFNRPGGALLPIKRNRAVHHRGPYFYLLSVKSDEGLLIRRDIEVVRKDTIFRNRTQLDIGPFYGFRSMLP